MNIKDPKNRGTILRYALTFIIIIFLLNAVTTGNNKEKKVPTYNEFISSLKKGDVKKIEAQPDLLKLTVTPKEAKGKKTKSYVIGYPGNDALTQITAISEKEKVPLTSKPVNTGTLFSLILTILPIIFIIGFFIFFMRKGAGGAGGLPFSKGHHKRYEDSAGSVTFKDVAGVDEAMEEVMEVKDFLSDTTKFKKLGAKTPRGVLLYGPPGTGKTMIAKSVANEAKVPFYSISGSSFQEIFVGVGASKVRNLFAEARENAPSIIFIDEIDSIGRSRANSISMGHDESGQTLNELLSQMDGFGSDENVIVFGATNRLDVLDPALIRPGRFDRTILVDRPDAHGREAILDVHSKGKPLADDVNFKVIASSTPGFTGADLANLINEAAILAARNNNTEIHQDDLQEAILRVITGPEKKNRLLNDNERKITAYHEVGHALVADYLPSCDPVHKISIVGRGQALGYTLSLPEEDTFLATKEEIIERMAMTLGGRAAEKIVFGSITTGASNDLEKVTSDAKNIVMKYAMIDGLGMRTFNNEEESGFLGGKSVSHQDYSEEMSIKIDNEIEKLTNQAYQMALDILNEHREELNIISEYLIIEENISKDKFAELLKPFKDKALIVSNNPVPVEAVTTVESEVTSKPKKKKKNKSSK